VKQLVGGAEAAPIMSEMLGLMATVAFQTMGPLLAPKKAQAPDRGPARDAGQVS